MVKKIITKKKDVKKEYDKKPNWKNATWRPNKRDTPEQLRQQIENYFLSISLTRPRFVEENLPIDEKTKYKVINTFFKYERWDIEASDDEEEDIVWIIDRDNKKKEKRKRIWYKTVLVPVLNNLWEQMTETIWYEEPMITWLAKYLWTTRETLIDYQWDEKFSDTIKRAKLLIEQKYEERLVWWWWSWSIFALKNMWWRDNRDISFKDQTPREESKDSHERTEEEIIAELAAIQLQKKNMEKK